MRWITCLVLMAIGLGFGALPAPKPILVLTGAKIFPVSAPPIEKGTLIIREGKIEAIGSAASVPIPEGARVIHLEGKVIIPGLVDTHSHIGIYPSPMVPAHADGNEMTGPVQSALRALDAVWPDDPRIRMARAGGVTTANIMPGSGNVMGGQTIYVKLRGHTVEEMLILKNGVSGGMKMANGENPKRSYGSRNQAPATRMAITALQRKQFLRAQQYLQKWEAYRKKRKKDPSAQPPARDLDLEPVVEILQGKRIVHFHTHRADDIMTAMRLAEEFGFKLVLQHVTEGYKVAGEIARRHIPCSIILVDAPGGKLEALHLRFENALLLYKAGVKVALHTDDFINDSRFFLREGALAVRAGVSESEALKMLTLNPAEMLGLEDRIGSLEPSKDADLVVLSGPPFSVYTHVLQTYIEGEKVFDRSNPIDLRYATGGFAVRERYPTLEEKP